MNYLKQTTSDDAAKKLAECMDYPWDHMPEQGRENMRKHAESIVSAAVATERNRWLNKARAHRDMTVMSKFATLRECEAARNAIQRLLDDEA